jgi:hypothetical protein
MRAKTGPFVPIAAWAAIGAALLASVAAWKLAGSSYAADVLTICDAEQASGFAIEKQMTRVTQWVRAHLTTPEGNELFSTIADTRVVDRAAQLRREATGRKIAVCPMVDAYERLAAQNEYRADLQKICSPLTFPDPGEQDDDMRLARLQAFVDTQAKSPRSRELVDSLRNAAAGARGKLLRTAAAEADIYRCEMARTFESPPPEAVGPPPNTSTTTIPK